MNHAMSRNAPAKTPACAYIVLLVLGIFAGKRLEAKQTEVLRALHNLDPAEDGDLERERHLIDLGQFAEAESLIKVSLRRDELIPSAHYLLAYTFLRQNKAKDALREYTVAAKLQPPTADDLRNVANAYAVLDDPPDAEKWMMRSVQMDPRDPNSWYGLGRIYYTEQRYGDAVTCFQKTVALDPKSVKAEDNLGLSYEQLNHIDEAIRAYRSAIALEKKYPESNGGVLFEQPLLNLAVLLIHHGQNDEAVLLLQRAEKLAPSNVTIHEQLGHVYLTQSRLDDAERELLAATSLVPDAASVHFFLGQVYRRKGQMDKAAQELTLSSTLLHKQSEP
jgi:tetratricopeptide (TPR) repeat protein